MDKFYFPMETMRITQNPYGNESHHNHNLGTPKDYPIDCAGIDGGKSAIFAPTEMKITAIQTGNKTSNTVWLVSTKEVKTPTFIDYVFMTLTHWNDADSAMKKHCHIGDIVKKGEIICYEGNDSARANHIHICVGRGYSDNWTTNSKGSLVITGDNKIPTEVMYRFTHFTTRVMDNGGMNWTSTDTDTYESFFPSRGWYTKGDSGNNVYKINEWLSNKVKGDYFGDYTTAIVKEFQRQNGLEADGNIGRLTLNKMIEQGFKE